MTKHKQRGYMSDGDIFILFIALMIVVLVVLVMTVNWASGISCEKRWANYKPTYSFMTDCMIEVNGKRIPADSVRGNEL